MVFLIFCLFLLFGLFKSDFFFLNLHLFACFLSERQNVKEKVEDRGMGLVFIGSFPQKTTIVRA